MKLSTRLLVNGAVLPTALLGLALAGVGAVLDHQLLAAVDRSLLAQAAVESVSLFDRVQGAHLHADDSTLETARAFSAWAALYGPDGSLQLRVPADAPAPPQLRPAAGHHTPALTTEPGGGGEAVRVLVATVAGPGGKHWALRLAQPLGPTRQVLATYAQAATAVGLLVAALLFGLQWRHGRQLHARVEALAAHLRRLRSGDLQADPAADPTADVLGELRALAHDATVQLRAARAAQHRLLADAAHELRTPLAVVQADLDVTLRRDRSHGELLEALGRIREEVLRLGELARHLLDLAALRSADLQKQPTDVVAVVQAAVQAWAAAAAERQLTVVLDAPAELVARVEAAGIRQVADNFLANAIDFAPPGTAVRVVVRAATTGAFELQVSDAGPGVPADQAEAVFQPFARLDRRREGCGLGLAIVRQVVERHGGRAWVEAAEGGGARFCAAVPAGKPS